MKLEEHYTISHQKSFTYNKLRNILVKQLIFNICIIFLKEILDIYLDICGLNLKFPIICIELTNRYLKFLRKKLETDFK